MKILNHELQDFKLSYPLEQLAPLDKILFIDIETTGFTAKSSMLYLIGCAWYNGTNWCITQWFATKYDNSSTDGVYWTPNARIIKNRNNIFLST